MSVFLVLLAVACTEKEKSLIATKAEGEGCSQISDCQPGFTCGKDSRVCTKLPQTSVAGREGSACTRTSDCRQGLCCGNQSVCRDRDSAFEADHCGFLAGEPCGLSADCDVGLVCDGRGLCAAPGGASQGGRGDSCEDFSDCRRPLLCGPASTCETPPFFAGISCERTEEELGAFRGYFEIPRGGAPLDEFYRQPFPSDVRLVGGHVDTTGHPSPGAVAGVDFTKLYLDAIKADDDGFGLSEPVFFQFSDVVTARTLTSTTVRLVNVDPASPGYGEEIPVQLAYDEDRGLFNCSNGLAVAPVDGLALRPRTTYAVIVSSTIRDGFGEPPIHDRDFDLVLSETRPTGDDEVHAWEAFAPLRAYLAARSIPAADVAIASVYTTGDPASMAPKVYSAVQAAPAPVVRTVVRCGAGVTSPCAEGQDRGCLPDDPAFIQLHAKVSSPVLQHGTRPYPSPGAEGTEGAIRVDGEGKVILEGSEDLCVGISIPRGGAMPAGGWPVVIYGHGTGGDFRSGLQEVAKPLAEVKDAGGQVLSRVAVVTFDGALHGPRQGLPPTLRRDPGRLFFNAANPRAARDNVLQGAADLHNLVRLVEALELTAAQTGAAAAKFDPAHIMYYGHSQGTVVGTPFVATEPHLRAAVFTGAGAEIGLTMIYKTKPNDVSAVTRAAFGDQSVTRLHPMIGLMSLFFGPSDAIPYAGAIAAEPPAGRHALDFLHVYGVDDNYCPEVTEQAFVRAGKYPIVGTVLQPITGLGTASVPTTTSPAHGNVNGASAGAVEFKPTRTGGVLDYDGHFVGTHDPQAIATIMHFLATAASRTTPAEIVR